MKTRLLTLLVIGSCCAQAAEAQKPNNGAPGRRGRNGNEPLRGQKHTTWEGGICLPFMVQTKEGRMNGVVLSRARIIASLEPDYRALLGRGVDLIETDIPIQVGAHAP